MQIIFVGDLKQLPAPIDDNMRSVLLATYKGTEFYDAKVYPKLEVQTIELTEVLRQNDLEFISALNIVRHGGKSEYFKQFISDTPRGVILAPHNTTVAQYNLAGLNSIDSDEIVFEAEVTGNVKASDFNLESRIRVKEGCSIMYLFNSKNNNLVNGTIGVFQIIEGMNFIDVKGVLYALQEIEISKKEYVLSDDQERLELREIGTIKQMPIRLAYALTIHKSQGLTFEECTVDLTLKCFAKGQLYTALSRVKSPEGLVIIAPQYAS
jgi:ATP-dependent DNA helicase PIF1